MRIIMNIKRYHHTKKSNCQKGFTVLELMTVIGIMAIMAAIGVPNYLSYIPKARLNGAARMVMEDLMKARMQAIKSNASTKIFFINNHEYKICNDADGNGTVDLNEGDVILRNIQDEYPGINLYYSINPAFSPRGTASSTTIRLRNNTDCTHITINIAGQIKIAYTHTYAS
jgi:type IV fimbrial biogenesis protein FimT